MTTQKKEGWGKKSTETKKKYIKSVESGQKLGRRRGWTLPQFQIDILPVHLLSLSKLCSPLSCQTAARNLILIHLRETSQILLRTSFFMESQPASCYCSRVCQKPSEGYLSAQWMVADAPVSETFLPSASCRCPSRSEACML